MKVQFFTVYTQINVMKFTCIVWVLFMLYEMWLKFRYMHEHIYRTYSFWVLAGILCIEVINRAAVNNKVTI